MLLEIRNLSKSYNNKTALDDFSISFSSGIYGILGANGAGKSTLMNLLTDNIKRDCGSILYDGIDILKMGVEFRRLVGYMPQQHGYYEQMSAFSFLQYMARLKGIKRREANDQIDMLLVETNMEQHKHKKMRNLSGGMKQRILLIQSLLGDPKIVILDEPTAGLDPQERIRIRNFISSIAVNRIILLATHIVTDIEFISNKVVMMKSGELVCFDSPEGLLDSLLGKVIEVPYSEINKMAKDARLTQAEYAIVNLYHRQSVTYVRIVGDDFQCLRGANVDRITLEDVYMYYLSMK